MKSTGIVRKIDNLGRVVLPIELRRTFNLEKEDPIEIFVDDDMIILKKYEPACIFCGNSENVENIMGKSICTACMGQLKSV